eukprot:TRINITY_DN11801_c0_g6_i1.p1 TRINITY_DN11801_c0_g6~~TRINITY_DN11801_c0_g6_i1.p1  ORF type:complete len:429 (+),score=91.05 TRINITY_DN11801_c0_g6_i1:66-1352(+)
MSSAPASRAKHDEECPVVSAESIATTDAPDIASSSGGSKTPTGTEAGAAVCDEDIEADGVLETQGMLEEPTTPVVKPKKSMWLSIPYIVAYWVCAVGLVFMNAHIIHTIRAPAAMTAWHMFCCSILVRVVKTLAPSFVKETGADLDANTILTKVAPVSLLFATSLALGNRAYLYLSVAFIQMIKAAHPVLTYMMNCLFQVEAFRRYKLEATFAVTLGVALSVTGELHFSALGFLFQVLASSCECTRCVLIGILLSTPGLKMDPLTALSYYAPLSFLALVPLSLLTEPVLEVSFWQNVFAEVGIVWILANGFLAFSLNLAVVATINATDPVVFVVVGVVKDIATVIISVFLIHIDVSSLQVVGYLVALVGVQLFNVVQKNPAAFESGLATGLLDISGLRRLLAAHAAVPDDGKLLQVDRGCSSSPLMKA